MFKYRVRKEDGNFITTIEMAGLRVATRSADSHEEAMEARDYAQGAGLRNFDEFVFAPYASVEELVDVIAAFDIEPGDPVEISDGVVTPITAAKHKGKKRN